MYQNFIPFYVWIIFIVFIHILFIHSWVGGHLCWFHLLAVVNNTVVNLCSSPCFQFLEWNLGGHMVILCLAFWRNSNRFPTEAATLYIPTSNVQEFQFLHPVVDTCYFPYQKLLLKPSFIKHESQSHLNKAALWRPLTPEGEERVVCIQRTGQGLDFKLF